MSWPKTIFIVVASFLFAAFVGYPFNSALVYLILWFGGALLLVKWLYKG